MNKKTFLSLFAVALLTACGDDDNTPTGGNNDDKGNDSEITVTPGTPNLDNYVTSVTKSEQRTDNVPAENLSWEVTYTGKLVNGQPQVASITYTNSNSSYQGEYPYTVSFDYSQSGQVNLTRRLSDRTENMTAILNDKGYVTTLREDDSEIYFSYDSNDRLVTVTDNTEGSWRQTFTYSSGGLLTCSSVEDDYFSEVFAIDTDSMYHHRYANNTSIDILPIVIGMDDDYDFLYMAGLLGKRIPYLPEIATTDAINPSDNFQYIFTTPNQTIHQQREYNNYPYWKFIGNYVFGVNTRPEHITWSERYIHNVCEYDVVVGDELVNPYTPDMGYQFTIENKVTTPYERANAHEIVINYK